VSQVVEFVPLRQAAGFANRLRPSSPNPAPVFFDRKELNQILALYSRKVIAGEWRDYAIEPGAHGAVFSVFRRTFDDPAYRVVKLPRGGADDGHYLVTGRGRVLGRGRALGRLLKVLDRAGLMLVKHD
jgi:hypothetical protein